MLSCSMLLRNILVGPVTAQLPESSENQAVGMVVENGRHMRGSRCYILLNMCLPNAWMVFDR